MFKGVELLPSKDHDENGDCSNSGMFRTVIELGLGPGPFWEHKGPAFAPGMSGGKSPRSFVFRQQHV